MEKIDRRVYTDRIIQLLGRGEVIVLTGHRRAGKSCILECLANRLKDEGNILFLDMENPDNAEISSFEKLNEWIKAHSITSGRNIILIDEVQEIRHFEKTLRYWVKQDGFDVVVTGSNAFMLSSDIAGAFGGRYIEIHVYSLSYPEYLLFNNAEDSLTSLYEYLRWGGLPYLSNIPVSDSRGRYDYLDSIYNTIFVKDILSRYQVRNSSFVGDLVHFVADTEGKLFSPYSISKYMKGRGVSVSPNTVSDYLEMLVSSFVIDRVSRFDIKGKRVFDQVAKYYFEDIGIRNCLCRGQVLSDREKVLENAVYLKLKQSDCEVYIGQIGQNEIDFIASKGDRIEYFQVCVDLSSEVTYSREIGNLKLIKDNYPKYIVTEDAYAAGRNEAGIEIISISDFLKRNW